MTAVDFPITLEVTRSELNLPALSLSPNDGYFVSRRGFGPGEQQMRRITVESPHVPGRTLVHAVKDSQTSTIKIRVVAATSAAVAAKIKILTDAFSQFRYQVTGTIDDYSISMVCEPADYTIGDGGAFDDLMLRAGTQVVSFTVPHYPVTL